VEKCREIGMTDVTTCKENILFSSVFKVYALHNYALVPPNGFDVLAESASCVHAIKHKHKTVYGVLFHPEVRNIEVVKRFIRAFQVNQRI
jgi:GMP synthase-like glutamine amidotransferase